MSRQLCSSVIEAAEARKPETITLDLVGPRTCGRCGATRRG